MIHSFHHLPLASPLAKREMAGVRDARKVYLPNRPVVKYFRTAALRGYSEAWGSGAMPQGVEHDQCITATLHRSKSR